MCLAVCTINGDCLIHPQVFHERTSVNASGHVAMEAASEGRGGLNGGTGVRDDQEVEYLHSAPWKAAGETAVVAGDLLSQYQHHPSKAAFLNWQQQPELPNNHFEERQQDDMWNHISRGGIHMLQGDQQGISPSSRPLEVSGLMNPSRVGVSERSLSRGSLDVTQQNSSWMAPLQPPSISTAPASRVRSLT